MNGLSKRRWQQPIAPQPLHCFLIESSDYIKPIASTKYEFS